MLASPGSTNEERTSQDGGANQSADNSPPILPPSDGSVFIPMQQWPRNPGPRRVKISIHYPGASLANVDSETGLMLTLHNWGGTDCVGTADPKVLAGRFNVVAICVNYLQSGREAAVDDTKPYDFGYLQALDALRALHFVYSGLDRLNKSFARGRMYATGGSGGGNVALMANKLAPRTFACVIDLSGMAKLSDDIAFNLPGGSRLNARYSQDAKSPNFLSADEQEVRFVGNPVHLQMMRRLGATTKVIVVHGAEDAICPFEDVREMVDNMQRAELDVEPHFITTEQVDGKLFKNTAHSLGSRTRIVSHVADRYLLPDSPVRLVRNGPSDFDRRDSSVMYHTSFGAFVVSYENGYPIGRFEQRKSP